MAASLPAAGGACLTVAPEPRRAILVLRTAESPDPASILPVTDKVWSARQACRPPRASTFFSAICAALNLAGAGLLSAASGARKKHRQDSKPKNNVVLPYPGKNTRRHGGVIANIDIVDL